jgi:putative inorganic carbon (HCO3(-)) transporter
MADKRTLADYEPVKRPRFSPAKSELDDEGWSELKGRSSSILGGTQSSQLSGSALPADEAAPLTDLRKKALASKQEPLAKENSNGQQQQRAFLSSSLPWKSTEWLKENWIVKRGHAVSFAGLFLFTFVLFFRPYELFPALAWLNSIAFWLAILTLIVFIPTQLGLEGRITARPREVNFVLLLFLMALLSIPLALDRLRAWDGVLEYTKVVLMFIVMVNVVRTEKRLKALLWVALVASCMLSLAAVNDYRIGNLALQGKRIAGILGGVFQNPNDLALHLVTMVPLSLVLFLSTRNPFTKIVYLLAAILMTAGIVATFSRGGFLGLACAVGVLFTKLARGGRLLFAALFVAMAMGFIALAPGGYGTRLTTTKDGSALARTDDLKRSIYLALRHPLFGVGMENYILYSNSDHATHNAYTQVAAEMGLIGAVFYVMFIFLPLKPLRRIEHMRKHLRGKRARYYFLAIGLQASFIGYIVSSFFASVAFLWYIYYLVAYAICLRRLFAVEEEAAVGVNADASNRTAPLEPITGIR